MPSRHSRSVCMNRAAHCSSVAPWSSHPNSSAARASLIVWAEKTSCPTFRPLSTAPKKFTKPPQPQKPHRDLGTCGKRFCLFPARVGVRDERRHAIVQLLHAFIAHVHHVPRFVPVVLDILGQRLRNRQMFVLILRGKKRRCQIVVTTVHHHLQPRIGLHRLCQIRSHVYTHGVA